MPQSTSGRGGTATGSCASPRTATRGRPSTPAFFPLYPFLVAVVGFLLLGHDVLAGVLVSLAAGAAAFVLLHRLTADRLGEDAARRTILFLALAPTSLFFGAVYSESLFLLLAVASFLLAERGRFWGAGAAAGLALLTRSAGIALLPALALLAWRAPDRKRALAGVAMAPLLFPLYPLLLAFWIGRPLAFLDAQKAVWERRLSPAGPLGGIVAAVQHHELLDLAVAIALVVLGIVAWRRSGPRTASTRSRASLCPCLRVGQDAAVVDAAFRRRRLPRLHGARDDRAWTPWHAADRGDSRRLARRVCGQMGVVVLGRLRSTRSPAPA